MVLCAIGHNFFATWAAFTLLGLISVLVLSGSVFYYYYWPSNVTYDKWRRKSNPKYPSPEKVKDEIIQTVKGIGSATLCPTFSLWLSANGYGYAFCGLHPTHPISNVVFTFFAVWLGTDLWSFCYHRLGHMVPALWSIHSHHHVFYNPSPFAVIADDMMDQFVRAGLLFIFPMIMEINIDLLFAEYAIFFYVYGVYLHCGHEVDYPDAHHPVVNTAFQHHCHHALAMINKPYHCGFYLKIWDQLTGGIYPDEKCFCAKCAFNKGERSPELFKKVEVPDYSVLLQPSFWLRSAKSV